MGRPEHSVRRVWCSLATSATNARLPGHWVLWGGMGRLRKPRGVLYMLGQVARFQGAFVRAQTCYAASLTLFRDMPATEGFFLNCLHGLGALAQAWGQPQRAVRLFGAVDGLFGRSHIDTNLLYARRGDFDRDVDATRAHLSAE